MAVDSYAGVEDPGLPSDLNQPQQVTANIVAQAVAYEASDVVFAFDDDLPLSALFKWHKGHAHNAKGAEPLVVRQQTSAGAAAALVAYSRNSSSSIAVVASSATFRLMAPTLRTADLRNVLFYVAGLSYDFQSGQLVGDIDGGYQTARDLGYKTFSAANAGADVQATARAAVQYTASADHPAVLLYDGLRGVTTSSFQPLGNAKGGDLSAYTYRGSKEPESVVVALASSPVSTESLLTVKIPDASIVDHIPHTASTVFVEGDALFRDVSSAIRVHFGVNNGPIVTKYKFEPNTTVPVLVWDSDKGLAERVFAPIVRASNYIGQQVQILQSYDHLIDSGSVEYAVAESEPFNSSKTEVLVVNRASILRASALTRLLPNGTLIIGGGVDEVNKLTDQQKREISNGGYTVYAFDYTLLDSEATQGRTNSFALQALIWQQIDPKASVDDLTSRIIHSNTQDMELLGSTISKLIENLREKALTKVDTAAWANVEVDAEKVIELAHFKPTALSPAEPIEEPVDTAATALSKTEIAKRLTFAESYGEEQRLRPEVNTKTFIAKVQTNQRVTPDDYDRHIFHFELDITGTGLKYAIGEALGVHAPNNSDDVREFIEWYKLDPQQAVAVPSRENPSVLETKTVFQALRDNIDLFGKVPKRFYEELAAVSQDKKEKLRLQKLCGPAGTEELKRRTEEDFENYVDVLKEFQHSHPPIEKLVEIIAPLKRREYSIASSQKIHPNAVHLLIVVVDWKNKNGETKYGQCSKFLADLEPGAEVTVSVKPSVMKLPKETKAPVIMAGLGTGLAPFKAFLEEKLWQRQQGHEIGDVYLFLGSRHQRQEYLYGELFEAYKAAGILTHIGAAFSRDQKEKIYIQHRIKQAKTELTDAFVQQNGNFYLCGPTWPVPDISEALYDIVSTDAASKGKQIGPEEEVIEELKDNERYILEVY